jgi:cell division protein FtsI (penicillin-binding protein 3)
MRWRARPAPPTSRSGPGGYYDDKVINTFASGLPGERPAICADRHAGRTGGHLGSEPRRTAGWTAVPVAAEIIRRVAPLMGLRPN